MQDILVYTIDIIVGKKCERKFKYETYMIFQDLNNYVLINKLFYNRYQKKNIFNKIRKYFVSYSDCFNQDVNIYSYCLYNSKNVPIEKINSLFYNENIFFESFKIYYSKERKNNCFLEYFNNDNEENYIIKKITENDYLDFIFQNLDYFEYLNKKCYCNDGPGSYYCDCFEYSNEADIFLDDIQYFVKQINEKYIEKFLDLFELFLCSDINIRNKISEVYYS